MRLRQANREAKLRSHIMPHRSVIEADTASRGVHSASPQWELAVTVCCRRDKSTTRAHQWPATWFGAYTQPLNSPFVFLFSRRNALRWQQDDVSVFVITSAGRRQLRGL